MGQQFFNPNFTRKINQMRDQINKDTQQLVSPRDYHRLKAKKNFMEELDSEQEHHFSQKRNI